MNLIQSGYRFLVCVASALLLGSGGEATAAPQRPPTMSYPALGLIDLDEGTVECQVKFAFNALAPHEKWLGHGGIFYFSPGKAGAKNDQWSLSIGTGPFGGNGPNKDKMRALVRFGIVAEGEELQYPIVATVPVAESDPSLTGWHHLAVTWKGTLARVYWDGQLIGEQKYKQPLARGLSEDARLYLGDGPGSFTENQLILDNFRISSVARNPDRGAGGGGGGAGEMKADPFTLMLQTFDAVQSPESLTADVAATEAGRASVPLAQAARRVEGESGQALALGTVPDTAAGK